MGWFSSRKETPETKSERATWLGIDLNAGRARASAGRTNRNRVHLLDDPHADLPLAISLEKRTAEMGRAGTRLVRRLPHAVCSSYLPFLGQPQEWVAGRHTVTADTAMAIALDRLKTAAAGFDQVALALPSYLITPQIAKLLPLVSRARIPLCGTAVASLAVVADRSASLLHGEPVRNDARTGVVPISRSGQSSSATATVVEIDEYALTIAVVRVDGEQAQIVSGSAYPRLGLKVWKDRLLDLIADRCVRLCRRDPRDSADAEQALYEQIDAALDLIREGHKVAVKARAAHWFQDLVLQPDDFEGFCAPLLKSTLQAVNDTVAAASLLEPPRAIWLLHDAGRLPGLRKLLHQNAAERTYIGVLPAEATAMAAANLAERWRAGELPRVHLDSTIPLQKKPAESKTTPAARTAPKRV